MKKSCSVPQIFKVSYFYKIFINSETGGAMISINAWDMVHFRVYRVYQKQPVMKLRQLIEQPWTIFFENTLFGSLIYGLVPDPF